MPTTIKKSFIYLHSLRAIIMSFLAKLSEISATNGVTLLKILYKVKALPKHAAINFVDNIHYLKHRFQKFYDLMANMKLIFGQTAC